MNLLDRYIAKQYLLNIVALLVILFCFVVTIDVSLNLARYWNVATEVAKQPQPAQEGAAAKAAPPSNSAGRRVLVTLLLIADLWWPRLLSLFNFMIGLVLVGAMGFTCTQLVRHRELVALLSSGQSLFRVARPILVVALGVTLVQTLNQELVIPRIAHLLTRDQGDAGKRDWGASRVPPTADGKNRLFYAARFNADRGVLEDLYIWERGEDGVATRRLHADRAVWRDGAWALEGATAESMVPGVAPGAPPAVVATDLDPTVLKIRQYAGYGQNLSWMQAREILSRMHESGLGTEQAQRQHDQIVRTSVGRLSTMVCNLLTLCIAMSFFLTRVPANMGLQALKCAPIGVVSLVGGVLGSAAAVPRLPPQLSVFLPVLVLVPVAVAMVSRVRT